MNWILAHSHSQSENCLAVSGDFSSDHESASEQFDNDSGEISSSPLDKKHLSASSSSTKSQTVSSLRVNFNPLATHYTLSPLRRWLLVPSYTLLFMVVLPFINGSLYTIGYRIGKRALKAVLNKFSKD